MKNKNIFINFIIIISWISICYAIASVRYRNELEHAVHKKIVAAEDSAISLEEAINRQLSGIFGVSDFLSKTHRVRDAVSIPFNKNNDAVTYKKHIWLKNPTLLDLDNFLEIAAKDFSLDQIFVLNSNADCIGSSLWRSESSCIGVNFSERSFFKKNKNGLKGMQYAMGKTTHKGGIFFSVPVQTKSDFDGSVVAKYNVENMASLLKTRDYFLLDNNQVIIYSSIPNAELKTLSSNTKSQLSETEINNIYQTNDISKITINKWEKNGSLPLVRINSISKNYPFLLIHRKIKEWDLELVILEPVDEINHLTKNKNHFFMALSILGIALILIFRINKELRLRD